MNTNMVSACSLIAQLSVEKNRTASFKTMEIHSFLELFSTFSVNVLQDVKKAEIQICSGARNLNLNA